MKMQLIKPLGTLIIDNRLKLLSKLSKEVNHHIILVLSGLRQISTPLRLNSSKSIRLISLLRYLMVRHLILLKVWVDMGL